MLTFSLGVCIHMLPSYQVTMAATDKLLLALLHLFAFAHDLSPFWVDSRNRIVGGSYALPTDAQFLCSLQTKAGQHKCTAVILDNSTVATAAHCLFQETVLGQTAVGRGTRQLRCGSLLYYSGGVVVPVEHYLIHPNYSPYGHSFDIALIGVTFPLENELKAVTLPNLDLTCYELKGFIMALGWAYLREDLTVPSPVLKKVHIPLWYDCPHDEHQFTAGNWDGGLDTCQGDSGGPAYQSGIVVGLTSYGYGCARSKHPGYYTLVSHFVPWINDEETKTLLAQSQPPDHEQRAAYYLIALFLLLLLAIAF